MEQKTQSKYILLEKPIFFNSKLTPKSQENISETQAQNKNTENNNNQNNQNKSPQKYRTFLNDPNETALWLLKKRIHKSKFITRRFFIF